MDANIKTQDGTLLHLVCASDGLHTLHVLAFVCNLGPRELPVECLPVIAHGSGGRKGWYPGWAAMQPKAGTWCSGTGH